MARINNAINYGSGFNIGVNGPIDSRMLVEFITDLTSEQTWPSTAPVFDGMMVTVKENNSIYILTNKDNYKSLSAWRLIGEALDGTKVSISDNYTKVNFGATQHITDKTFTSVDKGNTLDVAINKIDTNISNLISSADALKGRVDHITQDADELLDTFKEVKEWVDEHEEDFNALSDLTKTFATKDEVNASVTALNASVTNLSNTKADKTELTSAVNTLNASVTNLSNTKADKTEVNDAIDSLNTSVTNILNTKADKTELTSAVNTLNASVTNLSNTKADKTELTEAVTTLNNSIEDLSKEVIENEIVTAEALIKLENGRNEIKKDIEKLINDIIDNEYVVAESLTELQENKVSNDVFNEEMQSLRDEIQSLRAEIQELKDLLKQ